MAITISTHNGSAVRRAHNIRDRRVADKQKHIDPAGRHETWRDIPERNAYKILFGDAVQDYNDSQTRPERRIDDLWFKVNADKKQHTCYEMIAAVGKKGNTVDVDTAAEILRRFVDGWDERNPNLAMIGAYFHADEEGAPHVHIDYVPIAYGYKRGPETQPGLVKALGQQGFQKRKHSTPQIDWEHSENRALEQICAEYGIEVEHPQAGHGAEHVHTEQYKAEQNLAETRQKLARLANEAELVSDKAEMQKSVIEQIKAFYEQLFMLTPGETDPSDNELAHRVKVARNGTIKAEFTQEEWKEIRRGAIEAHTALDKLTDFAENLPSVQAYEQLAKWHKQTSAELYEERQKNEKLTKQLDNEKSERWNLEQAAGEKNGAWRHLSLGMFIRLRNEVGDADQELAYFGDQFRDLDAGFKWQPPEPDLRSFSTAVRSEQTQRQQRSETRTRRRDVDMDF